MNFPCKRSFVTGLSAFLALVTDVTAFYITLHSYLYIGDFTKKPVTTRYTLQTVSGSKARPVVKLPQAEKGKAREQAAKSMGLWRRLLLVPFSKTIEDAEQIKELSITLAEELPGILNWTLVGLDRLNSQGFTKPSDHGELVEQYRRDADPARTFLMDNYSESSNGESTKSADVYKLYRKFCNENGTEAMNERNLGQQVKQVFPNTERRNRGERGNREYVYTGLRSHI